MKKRLLLIILSSAALIILILFPQAAALGTREGITLCLQTVIPSLFPFMIITSVLSGTLSGVVSSKQGYISRIFAIPPNASYLVILGILGGYPIGAQSIAAALKDGLLDQKTAGRMMGFCNHAGPAFIFGISMTIFQDKRIGWCIWLIQILSAWIVSRFLPMAETISNMKGKESYFSPITALYLSVRTMGIVCGWVVLFRILIRYITICLDNYIPSVFLCVLSGILELANGCTSLSGIASMPLRFVLMNTFLSFGGICVWLQILSVANKIPPAYFIKGKLLHCSLATGLAAIMQIIIFP